MTTVEINPGVCGFVTTVTAESDDEQEVKVSVQSGCASIQKMMEALGSEFDAFEVCLVRPGEGVLFEYASKHFPVHAACPILSGMIKCMEVECRLALPAPASITFQ